MRHAKKMRPLVTFLMVMLIAAQFEYVTDASAFLSGPSAGGAVVSELAGNHPDHVLNHDGCDHCCHGANHLTAMAVCPLIIATHASASIPSAVQVDPTSVAVTPPLPPPIA